LSKIPKLIDHGHIIDSVVEIRFVPKNERTAFLDIIATVRDFIPNFKFQPTDIPRQIRLGDTQFEFSVEGTLVGEEYTVGIGFNTIVFNCHKGYKSWKEFFPFITRVLEAAKPSINKIIRIGVRYTNFFEGNNDLSKFNVLFNVGSQQNAVQSEKVHQMVLKFSLMKDIVSYNVTIANQASIPKALSPGALIDVDAYMDKQLHSSVDHELFSQIDLVHDKEKEMFFSLLSDSFLKSLNPRY
jgi:uncharacterized protein (TIGR04255 family)